MLESSHSDVKRCPEELDPLQLTEACTRNPQKTSKGPNAKPIDRQIKSGALEIQTKKRPEPEKTECALCRSLKNIDPKYAKTAAFLCYGSTSCRLSVYAGRRDGALASLVFAGAKPAGPEASAGRSHPPPPHTWKSRASLAA